MAVLKYGSLIVGASGKIPGGILSSNNLLKKSPGKLSFLIASGSAFARQMGYVVSVKQAWTALTVDQKLTWSHNEYVYKPHLGIRYVHLNNPWMLFKSWNMNRLLIGQIINNTFVLPNLSNYTPPPLTNWTLAGNVWTMPNSSFMPSYVWLIIQVTNLYSVSQAPNSAVYKFIFRVPGGRGTLQNLAAYFLAYFPAPTSIGQHFYCRYRFICQASGLASSWFYQSINVI